MNLESSDDGLQRPGRYAPRFGHDGRTAVFVAQDGSLVERVPQHTDPAMLQFTLGAVECLAALAAAGHALILFSGRNNRPGDRLTRAKLMRLQDATRRRLLAEAGVEVLDFVACPHAPSADGTPACLCRPPAPGLLLRASRLHGLDLSRSWVVGDTLDDVLAGQRAGCHAVLLDHGNAAERRRHAPPLRRPFVRCIAWDEVVHLVLLESRRTAAPSRRWGEKT